MSRSIVFSLVVVPKNKKSKPAPKRKNSDTKINNKRECEEKLHNFNLALHNNKHTQQDALLSHRWWSIELANKRRSGRRREEMMLDRCVMECYSISSIMSLWNWISHLFFSLTSHFSFYWLTPHRPIYRVCTRCSFVLKLEILRASELRSVLLMATHISSIQFYWHRQRYALHDTKEKRRVMLN